MHDLTYSWVIKKQLYVQGQDDHTLFYKHKEEK